MAYQKQTREITDEQFAKDTTIDGSRIDSAMGDVVERFNGLEPKDLTRRLVPSSYVWGWQPEPEENSTDFVASVTAPGTGYADATGVGTTGGGGAGLTVDIQTLAGAVTRVFVNAQGSGYSAGDVVTISGGGGNATATLSTSNTHHWPWLRNYNAAADVLSGTGTPDVFLNPLRTKGTRIPAVVNKTAAPIWPLGEQYAWTTELFFGRPVILDAVQLMFCLDQENAANPYGGTDPYVWGADYDEAGADASDEHTDLVVSVQVADLLSPRDRGRDALEVNRYDFKIERDMMSSITLSSSPTNDMTPSYPSAVASNAISGVAVQLEQLNIPMHLNSTARVIVTIPRYSATTSHGWWALQPWSKQYVTMVTTILEGLE
tara:strand:- start:10946 stop:12070 length:1125 start_codon:yes stop_codon:yes gene_type:complete